MKIFSVYNQKHRRIFLLAIYLLPLSFLCAQQKPDALKMYQAGQYKAAIEVCLNEIKLNPNNMDSYVVLGWALIADGQYAKAVKCCEEAKKISEYDPRILFSHGEACFALGKNADALNSLQNYIIYAPNGNKLAFVYYYFGEIYIRLKKYAHADIAFTTAVQLSPQFAPWWERLGYVREQLREFKFALQAYEQALVLDKNLHDAQNGRSRVLSLLQR